MDIFSVSSTVQCSHTPPQFAAKHHRAAATATTSTSAASFIRASSSSQDNAHKPATNSPDLRRPITSKPLKTSTSRSSQYPDNPLKNLINPLRTNNPPNPIVNSPPHDTISGKLWLSSKLSPPPPPPPPPLPPLQENEAEIEVSGNSEENEKGVEFREKGKIFVGNLPLWVKKNEVSEFFRQFGPIKNVILIKGHDELERNMGFGFVIYNGNTAEKAAMKAVEFDGVEFHGRVLTVKLDNGQRVKGKYAERARWVEGKEEGRDRSKWHDERDGSRREFAKVLESQPENWQAVVRAFERIKKVKSAF